MNEWFPYYLALGMTYEQYWRSDPYLTVYYQKAKKMKFDYDNQMAWINGMYIYDAVQAIVFNTWCRKEFRAEPRALFFKEGGLRLYG